MNLSPLKKLQRLDWFLLTLVLTLCVYSVMLIYSATYTNENPEFRMAYRLQMYWIVIGVAAFFVVALIDYNWLVRLALPIAGIALLLLLAVLIFGQYRNGAKSWIRIGPIGIQPAELTKLAFALTVTYFCVAYEDRIKSWKMFVGIVLLTLIPVGIILAQPDLGSAMVLFPMAGAVMYVAGVRKRYLMIPVILIAVVVSYTYWGVHLNGWTIKGLKPYQINRIKTFYDPSLDPQGAGWTINQSLIAVGSGGLRGKGYLQGTQNVLGFLPKDISYNDFIFSVACEEWGFLGGSFIVLLEGVIIVYCLFIASSARDTSGRLLATAIPAMLFTHLFVNVGMTIKVVPITGIPLPFISYGGTFLVVCLTGLGLVQSVWIHRRLT
jgi:rod shape determining protein RodA